MAMLARPQSVLDIADVEAFARRILMDALRKSRGHLDEVEFDDLLSFLIGAVYILQDKYDLRKNTSFSKYCYSILHFRVTDWYRKRRLDGRYYGDITLLSYDDELDTRISEAHEISELPSIAPGSRTILQLVIEGYKTHEIAERLGMDAKDVKRRVADCRQDLRAA